MPVMYVFLGDKPLAPAQEKVLETKLEKKSVKVEYELRQTTLDGKFDKPAVWNTELWNLVRKAIEFPGDRAAKKILSKIERPGTYNLEVEANGYVYRGKLAFTPADGDDSQPLIKAGTPPAKVELKVAGASKRRLPAQFQDELDELVNLMKRPRSYAFAGGSNPGQAWKCAFGRHRVTSRPDGKGWRARIDSSRGTPMMWSLHFDVAFDAATKGLTVSLTRIVEEH